MKTQAIVTESPHRESIGTGNHERAGSLFHRLSSLLFFVHTFFALAILLFYAETLGTFFVTHGEEQLSFKLFELMLPGLVLCSSVMISEPLYEALDKREDLRKLVVTVLFVNVALNVYLVRSFGYYGAATATLIAMAAYFLLFGNALTDRYRPDRLNLLFGAAAAFVVYAVVRSLKAEWPGTAWLLPVLFGLAFYCIGFFDPGFRGQPAPSEGVPS